MANSITLENARIIYRNFSGVESKFNPPGRRNFSVVLEEDFALQLRADGWNIKPLKKRDETEPQRYHLPVAVTFENFPPKVVLIQGRSMTTLTDETVGILDAAELKNVDLIIRPREWEPGKIKAYLKCGYFTVEQNELDRKYENWGEDEDMPF